MAKKTGVKLHPAQIRKLMQSDAVRDDLQRRADAIRDAAGGADDFESGAEVVGNRAMGWVVTASHEGRRAEAVDRALTRALDAGRR